MNTTDIKWTMINTGYSIRYEGSNGSIITRHGIGSKNWMGRNRQGGSKGSYYKLNGQGWFNTLKAAKLAAEAK